jgi:hypothetical protein
MYERRPINSRQIWTLSILLFLYECLVSEFGPYETWEKTESPGRGLDERFKVTCKAFGELRNTTSAAVKQQIAYATSKQVNYPKPQARLALLNKAAAYEAGFIRARDIPALQVA